MMIGDKGYGGNGKSTEVFKELHNYGWTNHELANFFGVSRNVIVDTDNGYADMIGYMLAKGEALLLVTRELTAQGLNAKRHIFETHNVRDINLTFTDLIFEHGEAEPSAKVYLALLEKDKTLA